MVKFSFNNLFFYVTYHSNEMDRHWNFRWEICEVITARGCKMHELFLRAKIIWYKRGFHSKPRFAGNRVWNVRLVNICANSQLDTGWTIGEGVYFACDEWIKNTFPRKLSLNMFGQHVCILRIFKLDFLPKREFHSPFPPCIYFPNLISSFLSSKRFFSLQNEAFRAK